MTITSLPTRAELVSRASAIVPLLQKHAQWHEEHRRLHEETIEAMARAGIFKLRIPKRYGGYESDIQTVVDVLTEIGRGDGSSAWTGQLWLHGAWIVGLFPDAVQEEVFSTPDVRVSALLSPTATAVRTEDGVVVSGQWHFNSGALHSHWDLVNAISITDEGAPKPILALIPMSQLEIIDDWNTSGLRGTGSVTTVAKEVFVPNARVLSITALTQGQSQSALNANLPLYRSPVILTGATLSSVTGLGLAKAALEAFLQRLPGRHIAYTAYDNQAEVQLTHLQVAEAAIKIEEAAFHASHAASLLDTKAASGETWSVEERSRVRLDAALIALRAKEAIDILNTASGGSSVYSSVPIQRIARDVQVLNLNGLLHPNTNLELYGRVLVGLPPNTLYL
ncbi:acyl-CoA dehydrogenase family protein [Ktedonobacter robiniae]|uniref:acyl-CoA dehydrogenase family protein n=1 Tax=Ktedonobacter robiniae TaxID=2778365 RepID=UPI0019166BB6|nr:acyl-CoA dehydrogenase family protein [Ktedonobacter robiniae]